MSYTRRSPPGARGSVGVGASGRNRPNDTGIFSPLLYQLSYRGGSVAWLSTRLSKSELLSCSGFKFTGQTLICQQRIRRYLSGRGGRDRETRLEDRDQQPEASGAGGSDAWGGRGAVASGQVTEAVTGKGAGDFAFLLRRQPGQRRRGEEENPAGPVAGEVLALK